MGRTSDEEGETSAKTCRSDDSGERPLKKARYVWQIKGKYHLKKPENEEGAKLFIADDSGDGYTLHPVELSHCETGTQGNDGGNTVDLAEGEVSKAEPACAASPMASEVPSPMESEDLNPWHLQKWQARQVARCFVDNTINRVLEDMGFIPLPVDADDLMEDFAMSGLRRNDEHLEDAAVMMAIHSHGLQRAVADMTGGSSDVRVVNFSGRQNSEQDQRWNVPDLENPSSPESPLCARCDFLADRIVLEGCSVAGEWSQSNAPCSGSEDHREDDTNEASKTSQTREPNESEDCSSNKNSEDEADETSSTSFEHTDFMDKAVAVAIQKKGLSTLGGLEFG